jgi:hypothetical protein
VETSLVEAERGAAIKANPPKIRVTRYLRMSLPPHDISNIKLNAREIRHPATYFSSSELETRSAEVRLLNGVGS